MANKNKKEQDELEKQFLLDQATYNNTGDVDILWNKMYPYLYEVALSSIKKKLKGAETRDSYQEIAQDVAISLIQRYVKNKAYHKDMPKTMVYLRMMDELYNKHRAYSKQDAYNYDLTNYNIWQEQLTYNNFEDDIIEKLSQEGY